MLNKCSVFVFPCRAGHQRHSAARVEVRRVVIKQEHCVFFPCRAGHSDVHVKVRRVVIKQEHCVFFPCRAGHQRHSAVRVKVRRVVIKQEHCVFFSLQSWAPTPHGCTGFPPSVTCVACGMKTPRPGTPVPAQYATQPTRSPHRSLASSPAHLITCCPHHWLTSSLAVVITGSPYH